MYFLYADFASDLLTLWKAVKCLYALILSEISLLSFENWCFRFKSVEHICVEVANEVNRRNANIHK